MIHSLRPSAFSRTLALIPPAVALVAQSAEALDMFLKIDTSSGTTIPGDSVDITHPGWIVASSFSFGVSNPSSLSSGMISGSKSSPTALTITKTLDQSSPSLFLGCAKGTIFPTVTMELQRITNAMVPVVFYRITLSDVLVSSLTTGNNLDDIPNESVSFNYKKIKVEYYKLNAKGGLTLLPAVSWDFVDNN